jgi:hypothetical protein
MEPTVPVKNQKTSLMAEALVKTAERETRQSAQYSLIRPSSFKYYIHDSVATLRFQLIGDLQASHVTELNGSWQTAKITLRDRRFVLDVSQLYSTDDEGQRWLSKMREAGAEFVPAKRPPVADQVASIKLSLLGRVLGMKCR